ncbi:MAG: PilZ domain-containing protein [Bdellovibrionota bacterium]|nr:PilZ domain-containing protein [Bdellovibrionota bacterium]
MENTNQNLLQKNYDEWSIQSIIDNTKLNERSVLAWKFVSGKKVTVEVTFYIIRKARKEIVVRAASRQGTKLLGELAASANNLNFYLPEDMVLFQTEVKQIEQNGDVRITIPAMIAQVDRRKSFRLFVENGISVKSTFKKLGHGHKQVEQLFKKDCFDISASGLSFIVSKPERKFFELGDKVSGITLEFDGKAIEFSAVVVNLQEIEPSPHNNLHYKGWKIAFQFNDIDSEHAKELDSFVFRYLDLDKAV